MRCHLRFRCLPAHFVGPLFEPGAAENAPVRKLHRHLQAHFASWFNSRQRVGAVRIDTDDLDCSDLHQRWRYLGSPRTRTGPRTGDAQSPERCGARSSTRCAVLVSGRIEPRPNTRREIGLLDDADLPLVDFVEPIGDIAAESRIVERIPPAMAERFRRSPDYFLTVQGDSMDRTRLRDGDVVAIRSTPEAQNGDVVVARFGGEVTPKRYVRLDERHVELRPESHIPEQAPIRTNLVKHILHIDGVAVGALIGGLGTTTMDSSDCARRPGPPPGTAEKTVTGREEVRGAAMGGPAGEEELAMASQSGGGKKRYHYYVDRKLRAAQSGTVFVCDHAYYCDPLYREAAEEEVVALIGVEVLRAAQDECGWNGLGSTSLLVAPVLERETGQKFRVVQGAQERWVLNGWNEGSGKGAPEPGR